jgi:hypothetical protein
MVANDLNRGGEHARGNWTVRLRSGKCLSPPNAEGREGPFLGTLTQLLDWTRQEALLTGQRPRDLGPYFVEDRNHVAHASYHLIMPAPCASSTTKSLRSKPLDLKQAFAGSWWSPSGLGPDLRGSERWLVGI